MTRRGAIEKGYISKLIASKPITANGLADMRGYDWSHAEKIRPYYYEDHIAKVDFSKSIAERGFRIEGATFEECIFDKSKWWISGFIRSKIIKCSFNDCCLSDSFLTGKYCDCSFKNLSGKGKYFHFGLGSLFTHCNFETVELNNLFDVYGVKFEDCKISGTFRNGVFRGWRYALKQRFGSVPDIFSRDYWPVKFIRCDLSNLKTENVLFEKDVVFKDCQLGDKSFLDTRVTK